MTVSNFKQIKIILRWSIKASCKLWRTPHNHWSSVPRKYLVSEGKSKIHTKKWLNQIDLTRFGNVRSLQYGQTTTSKTAWTHFKHYSCMLHSWNNLISLASERRFLCNPFISTNGMAFIVSHYAYLAFPFLSDEWRKLDSKARTLRGVPSTAAAMLFFLHLHSSPVFLQTQMKQCSHEISPG